MRLFAARVKVGSGKTTQLPRLPTLFSRNPGLILVHSRYVSMSGVFGFHDCHRISQLLNSADPFEPLIVPKTLNRISFFRQGCSLLATPNHRGAQAFAYLAGVFDKEKLGGGGRRAPFPERFFRCSVDLQVTSFLYLTGSHQASSFPLLVYTGPPRLQHGPAPHQHVLEKEAY